MSPETTRQFEQPQTLEDLWYSSRASHLQVYEKLTGVAGYRDEQQKKFMAGEIDNPVLDAPNLTQTDMDSYNSELWGLYARVDMYTNEPSPEREAYNGIISRKLAEVYYLHQARNLLDMGDDPERVRGGEWLMRQAEELYGLPERVRFNSMINNLRSKVTEHETSDQLTANIIQELLGLLPEPTPEASEDSLDYAALIEHYRPLVEAEFSGLLAVVPEDKDDFKPEDMVQVFSDGLKYYEEAGIVESGKWESYIDPDSKSISTSQEKCAVEVGAKRKSLNNMEMRQLLLHEVGVHVQRRLNGDRANFVALGSGLVGYEDPEEGLGVVMEQIYSGKTREAGIQYYTLLGLAIGLDGKPRDFRDIYEIGWRREAMLKVVNTDKELTEEVIAKAKSQAYIQCVRIFRGTPCNLPGVVYPKDIVYHDGNAKIWSYLNTIKGNEKAFKQLFKGKFNPTDPNQLKLVESATWS